MIIKYSKEFVKNYKKRIKPYPKLQRKFEERVPLFLRNSNSPILRDHALIGKMRTFRSFSITGDIRLIYFSESERVVLFIDIGTHNQVYK